MRETAQGLGRRGLPAGSSQARLLARERGVGPRGWHSPAFRQLGRG
jgi:hypothetical protein